MFIAVGVVGAVLLLIFLLFDDFLDEVLPDVDWISGPVLGAFLAAFGLFGWVADAGTDAPGWLAGLVGLGGGVGLGYVTFKLTRAIAGMATDDTPTPDALVGKEGRVVTAVVPGSVGEVLVTLGGQPVKLTAVSDAVLDRGTSVVVVDVASPTKVVVQSAQAFWNTGVQESPAD